VACKVRHSARPHRPWSTSSSIPAQANGPARVPATPRPGAARPWPRPRPHGCRTPPAPPAAPAGTPPGRGRHRACRTPEGWRAYPPRQRSCRPAPPARRVSGRCLGKVRRHLFALLCDHGRVGLAGPVGRAVTVLKVAAAAGRSRSRRTRSSQSGASAAALGVPSSLPPWRPAAGDGGSPRVH
jgi:hypothetical protein